MKQQPLCRLIMPKETLREAVKMLVMEVPLATISRKLGLGDISGPSLKRQLILFQFLDANKDEKPSPLLKKFLAPGLDPSVLTSYHKVTDMDKVRNKLPAEMKNIALAYSDQKLRDAIVASYLYEEGKTIRNVTYPALFPPVNHLFTDKKKVVKLVGYTFIGCYPIGHWVKLNT